MSNQIHITAKHLIKPSSPTPPHLQTFKFSILNQLMRPERTPIHLFFHPPSTHNEPLTDHLKRSLATVLTRFYPLAGIVIDNTHILCNDRGAIYCEARVDCPMSHFLDHQPNGSIANSLKLLIPNVDDHEMIMSVQVTTFSCKSIAICAALSHKIADAAACATFLNCWGAITRGADIEIKGVIVDSCNVFPTLDPSSLGLATKASSNSVRESLLATRRFVFTPNMISALQSMLASKGGNYRPSRIVALSALVWGSYIRAIQRKNGSNKRVKHVATHTIDLRGRVHPNIPGDCLNNVIKSSMGAEWPARSTNIDLASMATLMYADIKKYNDPEYVERIHKDGSYLNRRAELTKESGLGEVEWFRFSSNCKVPFYEADFGWGRPCWAVSALVPMERICLMLDGPPSTGGDVEAWITLVQQDMDVLEKDSFFMAFVHPDCHLVSKSKL